MKYKRNQHTWVVAWPTLTLKPKESITWPFTFGFLQCLIGGNSSKVSVCVQQQCVCVYLDKTKQKCNILYSSIMILCLVFITILGKWAECLLVISLHMYFYICFWMSCFFSFFFFVIFFTRIFYYFLPLNLWSHDMAVPYDSSRDVRQLG